MPFFNTGNAQWDQGFNTLGGALFPDPSKIGQATYYGAEARKAQIDAAKQQEQLAAGHQQLNMVFGQPPGQPTYSGTGPLNIPILNEPPPMGGSGGPPPGPAPAAAPPPPTAAAPPAPAGPVGSNMPPGALSALFSQGGGPVPQSQPVPQTMPPAQAAQAIAAKVEDHPAVTGAPSPPAAPPAPGAPPAPNTTGSDGSTPPGPEGTMLHPGSITPAGGGVKMSGPAAPDGSPAPAAFNLSQYVALAVMKGLPAEQALQQGQAVVAEWVKNGQMDQRTADNILSGLGQPAMRVANIGAASAANVANIQGATSRATTAMTVAGEIAKQNIVTNEKQEEFLNQEVQTRDPATGRMILKKRRDLQPGEQGYDTTIAQIGAKPVEVQPGGPGTPPISMPTDEAQRTRTPLYQPTVEAERQKVGSFIDPKNPTQLIPTTADDAMKRGLVSAPTTMDGWNALAASASANVSDPAQAQAIRDKVLAFATASTPKPADARENMRNQNIIDRQLQTLMPVPVTSTPIVGGMQTNKNPAGASPELGMTLSNLTDQYFQRSTDPAIRGNRIAAANAALKQMIAQGYINPNQDRSVSGFPGSTGSGSINKGVLNQDGTVDQVPHFRVDLIDPNTKQPYPAGQSPNIQMTTPLSSTVANASTPPAGAIAQAPAGAAEGQRAQLPDGRVGVVRGGWVFAQ
jgi:hypothetical protein